jgi:hypothetical protein
MITGKFAFNGVNIVLALTCLISLILVFKFVPDKRSRLLLAIAFVLIILAGGIFSYCVKIYALYAKAYIGELLGRVEQGTSDKVAMFKDVALLANVFELIAAGLFIGVSKRLISLRSREGAEGGASQ